MVLLNGLEHFARSLLKTQHTKFSKKNSKNLPKHLNFRISGQKLSLSSNITSCKTHINDLTLKLSRSNGLSSTLRQLGNVTQFHITQFSGHIYDNGCQVSGQFKTVCLSKIVLLQNREIRKIHFWPRNSPYGIRYLPEFLISTI